MAPVTPNGKITGYNIYINDKKIETALVTPGSYVVDELLPYTVYIIQVCTWVNDPFLASGDICRLQITFANCLDPDQDQQKYLFWYITGILIRMLASIND